MGRARHRLIEALEHRIIVSALGSEAERLYSFHADLSSRGLGLQNLHRLCNELSQWHRARIGSGSPAQEVRGDIRRDKLEYLCRRSLELIAERLGVGVNGGLCCAIGGRRSHRNKSQ